VFTSILGVDNEKSAAVSDGSPAGRVRKLSQSMDATPALISPKTERKRTNSVSKSPSRVHTPSISDMVPTQRTRKLSSSQPGPERKRHNSLSQNVEKLTIDNRSRKASTSQGAVSPKHERHRSASAGRDGERKRSNSMSEGGRQRHRSREDNREQRVFHAYRMHRVKMFNYTSHFINCLAGDQHNNRIALSRYSILVTS